MPKAVLIVLVIGILGLVIASLFIFHITDSVIPAKLAEPTKTMDTPINQAAGLKIEDIKVGTGQAVKSGDTVSINYLGTLTNGKKFDSSYDRGQDAQKPNPDGGKNGHMGGFPSQVEGEL